MKQKTKKSQKNSNEYFSDLKKRATIELFNLEHSSKFEPSDIDIIRQSLKNLIFYADKKLNPPSKPEKANETSCVQ